MGSLPRVAKVNCFADGFWLFKRGWCRSAHATELGSLDGGYGSYPYNRRIPVFKEFEARSGDVPPYPSDWALGYLAIRDEKRSLEWLNRAAENRLPYYWSAVQVAFALNSYADPILDQAEFVEVRSRLGFRE